MVPPLRGASATTDCKQYRFMSQGRKISAIVGVGSGPRLAGPSELSLPSSSLEHVAAWVSLELLWGS